MKYNNNDIVTHNKRDYDLFDSFGDLFRIPVISKEYSHIMKTDIKENENGYELEMDLPGYDKKDINIEINNGYLTISANKSENHEEKNKRYIRKERYYGNLSRSFYVGDIQEKDVVAKLENGTLFVNFPKERKVEERKRIEIK